MRRLRIILAAVFFVGILLGGIGAGLTMVEWSSLEYAGHRLIGGEHLATEDFDFKMKDDGSRIVLGSGYYTDRYAGEIAEDPTVPEGVVRYRVTYNDKLVRPYVEYAEYPREENESAEEISPDAAMDESADAEPVLDGIIFLTCSYYGDEWPLILENKDDILQTLKQGKISSYEIADITGVEIAVNPETMPQVENRMKG